MKASTPLYMLWSVLCTLLLASLASPGWADSGLARHRKMYAVPVPGKVVIDGKLDDWDLSGQINIYVVSETKDMQGVNFALMYDTEAIYLGAEVRDTTPLMNRHAPEADGDLGWDADACQFRIVLDPTQPYPVMDSAWKKEQNDAMVHLMLWNYTDRMEANLQLYRSMRYEFLPDTERFGVVSKTKFQGAYRMADDKRGYTMEYRIPWSTLGAKQPLKGGDIVAGTVQFNFSRPDGLRTSGTAGWCYDVMNGSGITFQNAGCWGKIIFAKEGHLPKEMVEEGVPPEPPAPLSFSYDLPADGQVTVALINADNEVVRTLVAQGDRTTGRNIERWDGLDEIGRPLPAGTYTWKGLYHQPIKTKFLLSVGNTGNPPYKTDDMKGGWGGSDGSPAAACAVGNTMVLAWQCNEAGYGLIKTDLDGHKQWGDTRMAGLIACDGRRVFTAAGVVGVTQNSVSVVDLNDFRPLTFGNGASALEVPPGEGDNSVTGLAYANGIIYVSYKARKLIGLFDAVQGTLKTTWTVPAPGQLAVAADGSVLAVSGGNNLVRITNGTVAPFATDHVADAQGIAVAPDGTVYVANRGALQDIAVFSPAGKYLRSIGKPGGRPRSGKYFPSGVLEPRGIALDSKGHLWVMEEMFSPSRISVWDVASGKLVTEYFGGTYDSAYTSADPLHPELVYCNGAEFKVDWKKGTWTPSATIWRSATPNAVGGLEGIGPAVFVPFTANNGKRYGYIAGWSALKASFIRVGDEYKPYLWLPVGNIPLIANDPAKRDSGYVWQDANNDQIIQENELVKLGQPWDGPRPIWTDKDLNLWQSDGSYFKPIRVEKDGRPIYDFTKAPERVPLAATAIPYNANPAIAVDPMDKSFYLLSPQDPPGTNIGLAHMTPDGKLLWGYRGVIMWPKALAMPAGKPGKLWGATCLMLPAGDYLGVTTYFGIYNLFTRDGLFVAGVMRDKRLDSALGPDMVACEAFNGQLIQLKGTNRYFLLNGDQDGRVTEILGLDTVKRLKGGTLTISAEEAKIAAEAYADYQARLAKARSLVIVKGREGLEVAPAVSKQLDTTRSFQARAAYDERNLYVRFDVNSPAELVNTMADPNIVFKGGNCLDIQLATDPAADPKRETPVAGDIRILVTRQNEKPLAVIYRPKVKGFKGEPVVLTSAVAKEVIDTIAASDKIGLDYLKQPGINGFQALVTIPLEVLGWTPERGTKVRMDVGYIYGNAVGNIAAVRAYWSNTGFAAGVVNDIPAESRLTPNEWGEAEVE